MHHRPVMNPPTSPPTPPRPSNMVPIWETCTCGRNSSPCSKRLVWIQSNQLLPQHAQKCKIPHTQSLIFVVEGGRFMVVGGGGLILKQQKAISLSGVTNFWQSLRALCFMLCQETSVYFLSPPVYLFLFFPNLAHAAFCTHTHLF